MANVSKETLDRQPVTTLGRAVQQAVDGGWYENGIRVCKVSCELERDFNDITFTVDVKGGEITETWNLYELIFSHDFAKALWPGNMKAANTPKWIFHLQQMVIADDPIAYLGAHI